MSFPGRKVLVVEDEAFIAMAAEADLKLLGCEVLGPALSLAQALRLVDERRADVALLDVNLAGRNIEAVADILASQGVPFAFATAYGPEALPQRFRDRPLLRKPYGLAEIRAVLGFLLPA